VGERGEKKSTHKKKKKRKEDLGDISMGKKAKKTPAKKKERRMHRKTGHIAT